MLCCIGETFNCFCGPELWTRGGWRPSFKWCVDNVGIASRLHPLSLLPFLSPLFFPSPSLFSHPSSPLPLFLLSLYSNSTIVHRTKTYWPPRIKNPNCPKLPSLGEQQSPAPPPHTEHLLWGTAQLQSPFGERGGLCSEKEGGFGWLKHQNHDQQEHTLRCWLRSTPKRDRECTYDMTQFWKGGNAFILILQMSEFFAKKPLEANVVAAVWPAKGYSITTHE